jgi:hypothetical protein
MADVMADEPKATATSSTPAPYAAPVHSAAPKAARKDPALFESVVHLLAPMLDELVFVGGCMTGLFITDPAAGGIRPTRDVDAIVDVTSYAEYTVLAERLREVGLYEDTTPGAPLCRWREGHLIVDIMPTDAAG